MLVVLKFAHQQLPLPRLVVCDGLGLAQLSRKVVLQLQKDGQGVVQLANTAEKIGILNGRLSLDIFHITYSIFSLFNLLHQVSKGSL